MISAQALALWMGLPAAGLTAVAGAVIVGQSFQPDWVVAAIVDGDTIDVATNGEQKRVRLLNVDTPETVDPNETVECMGPEAAAFLEELIPVGTVVELQYDKQRTDQYGRELAAVFVGEVLVNAEIARAGLGAADLVEPNDRFYPDVLAAQNEAQAAGRGLFDPNVECTVPAKVNQFSERADQLLSRDPMDDQDIPAMESYLAELGALALDGEVLSGLIHHNPGTLVAVLHQDDQSTTSSLRETQALLDGERDRIEADIKSQRERLEAERREAERLEAERREAERLEAERLEAERREAERLEAERREAERRETERLEAERQAPAQQDYSTGGSGGSNSGGSGGSNSGVSGGAGAGGYDGYTGCRAYGGGYVPNAVDEQGRPYTKIDCITKLPLP